MYIKKPRQEENNIYESFCMDNLISILLCQEIHLFLPYLQNIYIYIYIPYVPNTANKAEKN